VVGYPKFCHFGNSIPGRSKTKLSYRVSQNSRIPNSERGREGPSGALKILKKKFALPEEDISTLILFNIQGVAKLLYSELGDILLTK
jgi:hypothetical protein